MKQRKAGNYGWTPQQMARINSRREAKGQQPLLDNKMDDEEYMNQYDSYSQPKSKNDYSGIPRSQYDIENEAPLEDKMSSMQSSFRERFRKNKMLPKNMSNMRGAVSAPSIANSYLRMG